MALTMKQIYGGTLGTSSATLATAPASPLKWLIKEIVLCNKTGTSATATITIDGKNIATGKIVPANDSIILSLSTVVESLKVIAGLAGTASAIDVYISGVEG